MDSPRGNFEYYPNSTRCFVLYSIDHVETKCERNLQGKNYLLRIHRLYIYSTIHCTKCYYCLHTVSVPILYERGIKDSAQWSCVHLEVHRSRRAVGVLVEAKLIA
jgi:hypothetical protein